MELEQELSDVYAEASHLIVAFAHPWEPPSGVAGRHLRPELVELGLEKGVGDDQGLHGFLGVAATGRG